jgi:hypothetical protein
MAEERLTVAINISSHISDINILMKTSTIINKCVFKLKGYLVNFIKSKCIFVFEQDPMIFELNLTSSN